jgi:S1-C subfamily serine protease
LVQIAEKISPSVVTLTAYNSDGDQIKFGTGFFVHKSGGIATNWHVVSGAAKVTAKTSTGELLEVANVARYDPKLDVALCSLAETTRTFPAIADAYRKTPPRVGTSVAVLGTPEGLEQSLSQGIVSAIRHDDVGTFVQITAPVSPGSSGSPVVDNTGALIGIATLAKKEGQSLNFARSFSDVAGIWHDLRPQTFAEVSKERFLQFSKNQEAQKFFYKYESNSLREKAHLALALREAFPDIAESYVPTGAVFMEREDYQHAIEELEKARLFSPDDPVVFQAFGDLYDKIGQRDRAQDSFRHAKKLRDAEAKASKSSAATPGR